MQPKRFKDSATYLVNDNKKLVYAAENAAKAAESWDWLTYMGCTLNDLERFQEYQFTDQIDVPLKGAPPLNKPILSDTEWYAELPFTGEFSFSDKQLVLPGFEVVSA